MQVKDRKLQLCAFNKTVTAQVQVIEDTERDGGGLRQTMTFGGKGEGQGAHLICVVVHDSSNGPRYLRITHLHANGAPSSDKI